MYTMLQLSPPSFPSLPLQATQCLLCCCILSLAPLSQATNVRVPLFGGLWGEVEKGAGAFEAALELKAPSAPVARLLPESPKALAKKRQLQEGDVHFFLILCASLQHTCPQAISCLLHCTRRRTLALAYVLLQARTAARGSCRRAAMGARGSCRRAATGDGTCWKVCYTLTYIAYVGNKAGSQNRYSLEEEVLSNLQPHIALPCSRAVDTFKVKQLLSRTLAAVSTDRRQGSKVRNWVLPAGLAQDRKLLDLASIVAAGDLQEQHVKEPTYKHAFSSRVHTCPPLSC